MSQTGKSFRTPLGRVRALGSAHLGTNDASAMRVTSIALIPLTFGFVWLLLSLLRDDYKHARETLGQPLPAILLLLFVLAGVYHMQLGMRSVIMDYLHGHAREWAMLANAFFAIALGLTCVYAVLRIGFV
jgi:succinate dehydrogenase / fumarate reductase membrane anchor subunit